MSRYAEVEQLIANLDHGLWGKDWDKVLAEAIINDAPSIDIVRCKECKHASDNKVYGCMCNHFNDNDWAYHRMYADDFCSYGEREGE